MEITIYDHQIVQSIGQKPKMKPILSFTRT